MERLEDIVKVRGDIDTAFFLRVRAEGSIAWDVETTGLDWRSDRLGTVQLALPSGSVCVVQLETDRVPANLLTLLEMPSVRKIFHFAPFDLSFMVNEWRAKPQNVACTKVLSKIVRPNAASHSLKALLENVLGVRIEKSSVRVSNWAAFSLSDAQFEYAANDVIHLHRLFDELMKVAVSSGVATLAERSFDYLPTRVLTDMRGSGDVFAY